MKVEGCDFLFQIDFWRTCHDFLWKTNNFHKLNGLGKKKNGLDITTYSLKREAKGFSEELKFEKIRGISGWILHQSSFFLKNFILDQVSFLVIFEISAFQSFKKQALFWRVKTNIWSMMLKFFLVISKSTPVVIRRWSQSWLL